MKKTLKMVFLSIAVILVMLIAGTAIFMNFHPVFGGKPTVAQKESYKKSDNYTNGLFKNAIETNMEMGTWEAIKMIPEYLSKEGREPKVDIPVLKIDSLDIQKRIGDSTQITWFGHSSFLLEMESLKILLDPMLGATPSPVAILGSKRYSKELPIEIAQLPEIDLVIFSHDHYDHLDYESILLLKDKVKQFYVPLGLASHLEKWGVLPEKIKEFDWWDEADYKGLKLACTPARHFSGRGVADRFTTLWASWVIKGTEDNIYFSGDSGYGPHFKEIGEKYGPFNFAMMECGQYNERWDNIHMMPEETVQASIDIKAQQMMPIHWGAFTLALHPWQESVERATAAAEKKNVKMVLPQIGQTIAINEELLPNDKWWEKYL
ncbi:MBL fold metallo-hydrolase [uncultured Arcticibacterium sp.]|uniref:MBL fold metallo-hydrolase n=1 Tax=uncultured Arcticibacterium sp. TaxID=2173042 RepID=UPI0030F899C0